MLQKLDCDDTELYYLALEKNEDAYNLLVERYKKVIDHYSKKYTSVVEDKGLDYNDLFQEGMIGLDNAINSYKNHKDIKFSTFAFTCIKRKIYTAVKLANRKKHMALNESYSLDYNINDEDTLLSFININNEGIDDIVANEEMFNIINKKISEQLTDSEKKVYELRLDGFSYDEIARALDKSYKSVESTIGRVRIKIKKILNEII